MEVKRKRIRRKSKRLWLAHDDAYNPDKFWFPVAEIVVNGKLSRIVWKKPFRVNVSNTLKPGTNKLEIKVSNL